jgi:hypothetical protein
VNWSFFFWLVAGLVVLGGLLAILDTIMQENGW